MNHLQKNTQKGAAMLIVVLFFIILSVTLLVGVTGPIKNQIRNTNDTSSSKSSYNIADAQTENALYRFNNGKADAPTDLALNGATATAMVTEVGDEKTLTVQGSHYSNGGQSFFDRYIKAIFKANEGVSFNYGLQVGSGGLQMSGSSYVIGNVYANGDISGNGGNGWYTTYITGTAISATLSNPTISIDISSSTQNPALYNFGQNNTNQDIAQSFTAATSTFINEIQILIKKTGTPANATVKLVNNNSGAPGSTVLASGVLNSATVTNTSAYIPVVLGTQVSLNTNTVYWIVIDVASNNANNYYSASTYTGAFSGNTKQGRFGTSVANLANTNLDFAMKILVGGDKGSIQNMGIGTVGNKDAWANTVTNTIVNGSLYCQTGSGNNKACDNTRQDPPTVPYPVSQANIDAWKAAATAGTVIQGNVSVGGAGTRTLGPAKINGNLEVGSSGRLNITGPIYVTGKVTVGGAGKIYVDSSMGTESGVIISDDLIDLNGSGGVYGSGQTGSYIVLNSTKTCSSYAECLSNPSILVTGAAGAVVLNAPEGGVVFSGSASVKAAVAKRMIMSGATSIQYETGLADIHFDSGPSGSWIQQSWKEVLGL